MNKEVKETAVKAITKKTVTNTKRETVMYIGPTVRGVVINGTLFKDGKLKDLKSAMAICYSKAVEALTEKED